jgi:seryl-tRNA synthetase
MADLDSTLHKARAKAATAARALKSTERVAAAAKKSAQGAKLALKEARKASKKARKVARNARRAVDAASKAFEKATSRVKRVEARLVKTEGTQEDRRKTAAKGAAAPTTVTPTKAAAHARVHRPAGARSRKRARKVPSVPKPAIAPAVSAVEPSDEGDTFLLGESTLN